MSPIKILYICTHNRCRSALFEAITNQRSAQKGKTEGQQRLIAKSAGSAPVGEVHPLTLKYLRLAGYDTSDLSSNSWEDRAYMADFEPDLLITVCDNAAGEMCPVWLTDLPNMSRLHLGLQDPSKDTLDAKQTARNFASTITLIEQCVDKLQQIAKLPQEQRLEDYSQLTELLQNKQ